MKPRVLVVDDSAFARMLISRLLRETGAIDVVGVARDGRDALDKIAGLDPDIVTLDLTMPELDGLEVLRQLHARPRPRPRVIVVSISTIDSEPGAEALALGAIDLISKPTALASDRLAEIGSALIGKILATIPLPVAPVPPAIATSVLPAELVMIGTSTGGPQALTRVLAGLPADLHAPVTIALHIPVEYTGSLAARLDRSSPLHVVEAEDGMPIERGMAVLARGGSHLRVEGTRGALRARVDPLPLRPFAPSVDELFTSGTRSVGKGALGVVLTGMGDDGLAGARAIVAAGGRLITESVTTCVVYGMPRCVDEAGLGAVSVPLEGIAKEIVRG